MGLEAVLAAILGILALWMVLRPLARPESVKRRPDEPLEPEETPKGVALTALKEIEFDRETGKLSDPDYEQLKARYTAEAVRALRVETAGSGSDDIEAMVAGRVRALRSAGSSSALEAPACATCGPRPELDAVFCSSCGLRLVAPAACPQCSAPLSADSRFCEACGIRVAA